MRVFAEPVRNEMRTKCEEHVWSVFAGAHRMRQRTCRGQIE